MRWLRDWLGDGLGDWLGWSAAWTTVAQAPMWVWIGLDVLEERREVTLDAAPVAEWLHPVALVPAVVVPLAALLSLVPRTRRVGLALGGAGLLVASWAWSGLADDDVGPWYVALSAAAGIVGLVSAGVGPGSWSIRAGDPYGRAVAAVAGLALAGAGLYLVWTCVQGGSYWQWMGRQRWTYGAGVVAGASVAVAGATAVWWRDLHAGAARALAVVLTAVPGVLLLVGGYVFVTEGGGVVFRWEEIENPWGFATPCLLAGTGFLAGTVAALRRRGDLLAVSVAAAVATGLTALWQESTWGRVIG